MSDLSGTKFYRWNIISKAGKVGKNLKYNCICDCGTSKTVYANSLHEKANRSSKSCGCYKNEKMKERFKTHGYNSEGRIRSEYNSWHAMKSRCANPKEKGYERYGGRGIKVCKEWKKFDNFIKDMGNKPTPAYTLERLDNDGNYEPSNCVWETRVAQSHNTGMYKNNKTGVKGVHYNKKTGKYVASLQFKGKKVFCRTSETLEGATILRESAEKMYLK